MTKFDSLSVMFLEDEFLIALDGEGMLNSLGVKHVQVVNTLQAAAELAEKGDVDVALLDLNVNGEMSWRIADILHRRGIPVVFASGYELRDTELGVFLKKPYTPESLKEALEAALAKAIIGPPPSNQIGRLL
jgi:CheY-like chemotaxis protein